MYTYESRAGSGTLQKEHARTHTNMHTCFGQKYSQHNTHRINGIISSVVCVCGVCLFRIPMCLMFVGKYVLVFFWKSPRSLFAGDNNVRRRCKAVAMYFFVFYDVDCSQYREQSGSVRLSLLCNVYICAQTCVP